jgi:hypothetical protein
MVIGAVESAVLRACGEVSDFAAVAESAPNRSRAERYGGNPLQHATGKTQKPR